MTLKTKSARRPNVSHWDTEGSASPSNPTSRNRERGDALERNLTVAVRCTADEKLKLVSIARDEQISLSDLLRRKLGVGFGRGVDGRVTRHGRLVREVGRAQLRLDQLRLLINSSAHSEKQTIASVRIATELVAIERTLNDAIRAAASE